MATQSLCAICGRPVDKTLKFPDAFSATVDHIIPVARGGHPSDIDNLQLAHFQCNRLKADKLFAKGNMKTKEQVKQIGNTDLPLSADWLTY